MLIIYRIYILYVSFVCLFMTVWLGVGMFRNVPGIVALVVCFVIKQCALNVIEFA